jgi:hypothetical protein
VVEDERRDWCETTIEGFEIRVTGRAGAARVLGWEGVVPIPLVRALEPELIRMPAESASMHGVSAG